MTEIFESQMNADDEAVGNKYGFSVWFDEKMLVSDSVDTIFADFYHCPHRCFVKTRAV